MEDKIVSDGNIDTHPVGSKKGYPDGDIETINHVELLREHQRFELAKAALQGLLANTKTEPSADEYDSARNEPLASYYESIALTSVLYADYLLKALYGNPNKATT